MKRPAPIHSRRRLLVLLKQRLARYLGRPAPIRFVLSADRVCAPLVAYVAEESITFRRTPHYR